MSKPSDDNTKHQELLDLAIDSIFSGKAILFTGAGFSVGSTNIKNTNPPKASDLSKEICRLGNFEEDEDLRFAADYYLTNNNKSPLIELLSDTYTIKNTSPEQDLIMSANWRRHYTTNYDNAMELSALKSDKRLTTIDLTARPDKFAKASNLCIHINGSIDSLTIDSLENGFKLSTSSYISSDTFTDSPWYYQFKRDLEVSTAIIFIGYSMYDIDIQKILFSNQNLKDKTYFITQQNPSPKDLFTLSKFGNVLPIGTEGFANAIKISALNAEKIPEEKTLCFFEEYATEASSYSVQDRDVESLIFYGELKQTAIDFSITGAPTTPAIVVRKELETIQRFLEAKRNTIISSAFGNGKTILTRQVLPYLQVRGFDAYSISDPDADYTQDIEIIQSKNSKSVLVIDDYQNHIDILRYIGTNKPENIFVVATARVHIHERMRQELRDTGFTYQELYSDQLSDPELNQLIDIIDNVGAWGDKAGLSPAQKREFLCHENDAQISLALLSVFDSPQIKQRITHLMGFCSEPNKAHYLDTVFAICLIEIMGLPTTNSFISEIALNDDIYSDELRANDSFRQLFRISSQGISSKSSLFCLSLIKHHFTPTYITSQLLKIVKKYGERDGKVREENEVFRSLVKFSFIERLLPDTNKKTAIKRYYENLKTNVRWLKSDPHFWLQYAMAHIPSKEYSKAQQYMDQSYALAKKKVNYHTNHHDTQQGRLYLLQALEPNNSMQAYELFSKANQLFSKIDNDIYKFRQVDKYKDFFDHCYEGLSKRNKSDYEHACKKMLKDIAKLTKNENDYIGKTILRVQEKLEIILATIVHSRTQ
jgi:hypothetical protein